MSMQDPSTPLPTDSKDSSTTESSNQLPSKQELLDLLDSHSPSAQSALMPSRPTDITPYEYSIHLSVRIDRKDSDIHCRMFVNHKFAGKLVIQADEFIVFRNALESLGCEFIDEMNYIRDTYLQFESGVSYARKLYKS